MDITSGISALNWNTINTTQTTASTSASNRLQETLEDGQLNQASDDELMEVCKSFESYFIEQVMKEAKKTAPTEEDENTYMQYFGDTLIQEYAKNLSDHGNLGIAQNMYESMKRNGL